MKTHYNKNFSAYLIKRARSTEVVGAFQHNFPAQTPTDEVISDGYNYILEEAVIDTGDSDQYHLKWYNDILVGISIYSRGQLPQNKS